jgi:hypothetical protein
MLKSLLGDMRSAFMVLWNSILAWIYNIMKSDDFARKLQPVKTEGLLDKSCHIVSVY